MQSCSPYNTISHETFLHKLIKRKNPFEIHFQDHHIISMIWYNWLRSLIMGYGLKTFLLYADYHKYFSSHGNITTRLFRDYYLTSESSRSILHMSFALSTMFYNKKIYDSILIQAIFISCAHWCNYVELLLFVYNKRIAWFSEYDNNLKKVNQA